MAALAAVFVVLGGLVAAVTDPLALDKGSWLAAYLVLVCGVAQHVMALRRARGRTPGASPGGAWAQLGLWNAGNAAVVAGSLAGVPGAVDAGSALLVGALALALRADRTVPGPDLRAWVYRGMLLVLLVSIPVGAVLAHLDPRH